MRTNQNFGLFYFLLVICQVIMCNYTNLGPYVILTMLPAMVLCIPTGVNTALCMLIAFASGICVDWLSEGMLGLNAASLTAAGLLRKTFIRLFLGEDIISRNDSFSIRRNGIGKVSLAQAASISVFLIIYITLDGAGTRPFWFCLARFAASLACCMPLGIMVTNILTPDDRK